MGSCYCIHAQCLYMKGQVRCSRGLITRCECMNIINTYINYMMMLYHVALWMQQTKLESHCGNMQLADVR